jgi:hypothetical protein
LQSERQQHLAAIFLFLAMIVLVFHRAIFFGEVLAPVDLLTKELPWKAVLPGDVRIDNFTQADVLTVFEPWRHFVHEELQAGRFPLWCSKVGCGYPLAGQGMINLFGLTTICLWVWPPRVAMVAAYSTQLFLAMLGMYVLLYSLRMRWRSALFGALVFGLNSRVFQDLELNCTTGALVMFPWICWALCRGVEGERKWFVLAGLFYGWGILNGSLQTHVIVWISAVGFAATLIWLRDRRRFVRRLLSVIATFSVLGWMVGAIALAPNLELLAHNERARLGHIDWLALMTQRPLAILPWLIALFNPDAIGNSQTFDLIRGLGHLGQGATTPTMDDLRQYCGLGAVALAVLGLRTRGPVRVLGGLLVVLPAVVGFITPLYLLLYFRSLALVPCGIGLLAAVGFDRLLESDQKLRPDVRKIAVSLAAGVAVASAVGTFVTINRASLTSEVEEIGLKKTTIYRSDVQWQKSKARRTVNNFAVGGAAVARFSILGAIIAMLLCMRRHASAMAGALLFFNTADLVEFSWRTFSSVPSGFHYPTTPGLEHIRRQAGYFRVASVWDPNTQVPTGRQNMLMIYGIDDPRVSDALIPANPLLNALDWDALNVKYLMMPPHTVVPAENWKRVYQGEVDIYENPHVAPRVEMRGGEAKIQRYVSGDIELNVDSPNGGVLVVRERGYPGWTVRVDGKPVTWKQVDGLWLSVSVPAGRCRVEFRYRPATVLGGVLVSGLSFAGAVVLVFRRLFGRRIWASRTRSTAANR